ncbi:MAG: hypothetical protein JETCAE03_32240 [Ignavibacteriaceae bacterium]|jgi:hypothetical protein|nr:MAG: hypothetical protein JETCAE03_32240 [Ignavibacteriaceae bacterium]
MFEREELQQIESKCANYLRDRQHINPNWVRAVEDLRHAACVLDAFIARSTVLEKIPIEIDETKNPIREDLQGV